MCVFPGCPGKLAYVLALLIVLLTFSLAALNNKYLVYDSFYESEIQIQLDGVRLTQKLLQGCSQGVAGASRLSAGLGGFCFPASWPQKTQFLGHSHGYWQVSLAIG